MTWRSIALGVAALVAGAAIALVAARRSAANTVAARAPETNKDKVSYAMGVTMARSFERQKVELDPDFVARGLKDELSGGKLLVEETDLRAAMETLQGDLKNRQAAANAAVEEGRKRGEAILADNSRKEGVVTLPSGLQYRILKAGEGRKATDRDTVQCHYRSMRIDGTEVDNSYKRDRPATVQVGRALPAWKEALKLMPSGSKWELYAPAALAFGQRGLRAKSGAAVIGPNMPVIFELELVAINPGTQAAAGAEAAPAREN
jgi:FKBP-type peptidyl-prolyl cis-trans isomerase